MDHLAEPADRVAMNSTATYPMLTFEETEPQQDLEQVAWSNKEETVQRFQISTMEGEARGKKCHLSLVKKA